jgi:hypothetical protein
MMRISNPALRQLGVLAVFVALTVVMTYPLAFHLTDQIPGWPGDNFHYSDPYRAVGRPGPTSGSGKAKSAYPPHLLRNALCLYFGTSL